MTKQQRKKKSGKSQNNNVSPYQQAGSILNQVWSSNSSNNSSSSKSSALKSAVYDASSGNLKCSSSTYAICSKVLQHQATLQSVLEQQAGDDDITRDVQNEGLFYVLLYELLLGPNKAIRGGGAVKRQILKQEDALRKALADIQQREGLTEPGSGSSKDSHHYLHPFPRYVRVNTLRTTTSHVVATWRQQQQQQQQQQVDSKKQKGDSSSTDCSIFYQDAHVPDLLVFPHNATRALLSSSLSRNHEIVLQDKSSCFPALCLVHGFSDHNNSGRTSSCNNRVYLDACAAPGNKTSHLAALASSSVAAAAASQHDHDKDDGDTTAAPVQVYALDRSKDRCAQLKRRMQQLSPDTIDKVQIHAQCRDFLSLGRRDDTNNKVDTSSDKKKSKKEHDEDSSNDQDLVQKVTDILLDPSCSGSGIFHRSNDSSEGGGGGGGDHGGSNYDEHHRLQSLSNFQTTALRHALTSFPNVQRVVYSTCSVHHQENEGVVAEVLSDPDIASRWQLIAPACLADWKRRGKEPEKLGSNNTNKYSSLTKDQLAALIRVDRDDETNGFFVACFERKDDSSTTPLKVSKKNKNKTKSSSSSSSTNTFTRAVASDVPVYNGEFKLMTRTSVKNSNKDVTSSSSTRKSKHSPTDETSSGSTGKKRKTSGARNESSPPPKPGMRDEQEDGDINKKRKKKIHPEQQAPADATSTKQSQKTKDSSPQVGDGEVHADHDKPLPKKIAKKLAWKKRQRELKQQRMQSKQKQKS